MRPSQLQGPHRFVSQQPTMPRLLLLVCLLLLQASSLAQQVQISSPADLASKDARALAVTRDQIRADRKGLVEKAMNFTSVEAAAFWPVYEQYKDELARVDDRTLKLVTEFGANYKSLSDDEALRMSGEALSIDAEKLRIKRAYVSKFSGVLPGKKVARFYQVEKRLDAVMTLNSAQVISLVQ